MSAAAGLAAGLAAAAWGAVTERPSGSAIPCSSFSRCWKTWTIAAGHGFGRRMSRVGPRRQWRRAAGRGREGGGGAGSTQATWRRLLALLLGDEVHLVHEAEDLRRLRVLTHRSEACARERGGVSDAPARHHAMLSESRAGPSRRTRAGACSHEA